MQITAAVARAAGAPFTIESLELEAPRADEIRVRIASAGLCHTDLASREQMIPVPLPIVLGHEGAGVVEAVGSDVNDIAVGDHVALSFAACGGCINCGAGVPGYCHHFMPLNFGGGRDDGSRALMHGEEPVASHFFGQSSFASHALVSRRNAVKVRADAPLEMLGPLGCGVQTGAGSIMCALGCESGSSLLVLGGGSVGLSAVLGGVVQGCETIIVSEPMSGGKRPNKWGDAYFGFYTAAMTSGTPRSADMHAAMLRDAGFRAVRILKSRQPFITQVVTGVK